MLFSRNNTRPGMLLMALLTVAAAIVCNARIASAQNQCCNINIRNSTDCRFDVCLITATGERCVTIAPGGNNFDVPNCPPDYRFVVRDVCGVTHAMPSVPGTSINVRTSHGCCLRIYLASPCCWEVTVADSCAPCGA